MKKEIETYVGKKGTVVLGGLVVEVKIQDVKQGSREQPFYSSIQGKLEELPNGNVMAVEPEGGRIFEVDRASGEIVWEYINFLEPGYVGRVTQAVPFRRQDLTFLEEK